jgi:hypothetical protein
MLGKYPNLLVSIANFTGTVTLARLNYWLVPGAYGPSCKLRGIMGWRGDTVLSFVGCAPLCSFMYHNVHQADTDLSCPLQTT